MTIQPDFNGPPTNPSPDEVLDALAQHIGARLSIIQNRMQASEEFVSDEHRWTLLSETRHRFARDRDSAEARLAAWFPHLDRRP